MNPSSESSAPDISEHPAKPQRPARLVGVGHVALDHVFEVDAIPTVATKTAARDYRSHVGGMTANALVAASRLGASAVMVAPVGDDEALPIFQAHFAQEGVDASGLVRVPGARHSVAVILVDAHGERSIVSHRSDAGQRAGPFNVACLDGADVLLTDPRFVDWAQAALKAARARSVVSVLDAEVAPRQDLDRLVGLATWAVFSEPGLDVYAGIVPDAVDRSTDLAAGLAKALKAGAEVAVVTLGARGLMWQRRGGDLHAMAAWPVSPVVDTTAAGDVFHGALAVALAEGCSDESALRWAACAAALKCQQAGGVQGAPKRQAVDAYLAAHCVLSSD